MVMIEKSCGRLVCGDHEILNQETCSILLPRMQVHDAAIRGHDGLKLQGMEGKGSSIMASVP